MYREAITDAGEVPFTPGYSAPESFVRGEIDAPADVFALGVTLYRLLTGEKLLGELQLAEQFQLMTRREHYQLLLDEQLGALGDAIEGQDLQDTRALLEDMLAWAPTERARANEVVQRAEVLEDQLSGPTLKRWAKRTTLAAEYSRIDGSLSGQTLPEDTIGETISVIPGVLPGGPASLPPHLAGQLSPELLAIAETTLGSTGASLPSPEGGLHTLNSVYSSGTLPAVTGSSPVKIERRREAPGSSRSVLVNVVVAFGIFVVVTVPMGTLVVMFFAWLNG
jgi:serine/threonine protein kinase